MSKRKNNRHNIAIRLHKDSVANYEDVLKSRYMENGTNPAVKIELPKKYGHGVLYALTNQHSRPEWAKDVEAFTNNRFSVPDNSYSKAVIVLRITTRSKVTRFMSISFGYGDAMLDKSLVEDDFGRNIAAQKIQGSKVTSAATFQVTDAIIQMEKQYAGRVNGGIRQLVASKSEFPSKIAGTWRNGQIETRLVGSGELLNASREMALEDVVDDLKYYLGAYLRPTEMADWTTRITKIPSGKHSKILDNELMNRMIYGEYDYGVAWPTYKDMDNLSIRLLKRTPDIPPVEQLEWYIDTKIQGDDKHRAEQLLAKIKRTSLTATNSDGNEESTPLYSAIFASINFENNQYVLFKSNWYRVNENFYEELKNKLDSVEEYPIPLPKLGMKMCANDGKTSYLGEGDYNDLLSRTVDGGFLFDKVLFSDNSQPGDPVEPADVITNNKELFFVKKGSSSAALSHLFLQGLVSAKLLAIPESNDFRDFINDHIGEAADIFTDNVSSREITLVFVIIKKTSNLPFFSMISFSEVLDDLREMGYTVKIAWPGMITLPKG